MKIYHSFKIAIINRMILLAVKAHETYTIIGNNSKGFFKKSLI